MPNWNSCTIPVTTPSAKLIRKSFPKNFVSLQPLRVAGPHPGGLVAGHDRRQADRDRDEEEVVDGDDAELPAGKVEWVHAHSLVAPLGTG